jgi:hypothetical protein
LGGKPVDFATGPDLKEEEVRIAGGQAVVALQTMTKVR